MLSFCLTAWVRPALLKAPPAGLCYYCLRVNTSTSADHSASVVPSVGHSGEWMPGTGMWSLSQDSNSSCRQMMDVLWSISSVNASWCDYYAVLFPTAATCSGLSPRTIEHPSLQVILTNLSFVSFASCHNPLILTDYLPVRLQSCPSIPAFWRVIFLVKWSPVFKMLLRCHLL